VNGTEFDLNLLQYNSLPSRRKETLESEHQSRAKKTLESEHQSRGKKTLESEHQSRGYIHVFVSKTEDLCDLLAVLIAPSWLLLFSKVDLLIILVYDSALRIYRSGGCMNFRL